MQIHQFDLDDMPPPLAKLVDAGADEQLPNPTFEPLRVAQAPPASPCADEGLLGDIPRRFAARDEQASGCIETADGLSGQLCERIAIAGPRPHHQINVHRLDSLEWAP